jgi:hypothetical protein
VPPRTALESGDHFIVENATADRAHPHVSARREGAAAVAVLPELDELLGHVSDTGLHCKAKRERERSPRDKPWGSPFCDSSSHWVSDYSAWHWPSAQVGVTTLQLASMMQSNG